MDRVLFGGSGTVTELPEPGIRAVCGEVSELDGEGDLPAGLVGLEVGHRQRTGFSGYKLLFRG